MYVGVSVSLPLVIEPKPAFIDQEISPIFSKLALVSSVWVVIDVHIISPAIKFPELSLIELPNDNSAIGLTLSVICFDIVATKDWSSSFKSPSPSESTRLSQAPGAVTIASRTICPEKVGFTSKVGLIKLLVPNSKSPPSFPLIILQLIFSE